MSIQAQKSAAYDAIFDPSTSGWVNGWTHAQAAAWVSQETGIRVTKEAARKACKARREKVSAGTYDSAPAFAQRESFVGSPPQVPTFCNGSTSPSPPPSAVGDVEPETLRSFRGSDLPPMAPLPVEGDPKRDPSLHGPTAPDGYHVSAVTVQEGPAGEVKGRTYRTAIGKRDAVEELQSAIPDGHYVERLTTTLNGSGEVERQYVKTKRERTTGPSAIMAAFREDLGDLLEPIRGVAGTTPKPDDLNGDLLWQLLWGDPHFGMLAWANEVGGKSWDLEIAERVHYAASLELIRQAPPAERAVFCTIGDTSHADNSKGVTPHSGIILDVDSRWRKVVRAIARVIEQTIRVMLTKFGHVDVKIVPGNHDPHTSAAIQMVLEAIFRDEPRVTVDDSEDCYLWLQWERCMFLYAHGDGGKLADLPTIMACDRAEWWGKSAEGGRHAYSGHIHHKQDKVWRGRDLPGASTESLATMAGKDFWHHWKGYRAAQRMKGDTWHRLGACVNTNRVTPGYLEGMGLLDGEAA